MDVESIASRIKDHKKKYPNSEYSFAHIVLSDYNLGYSDIEHCLSSLRIVNSVVDQSKIIRGNHPGYDFGVALGIADMLDESAATIRLLCDLLRAPGDVLDKASSILCPEEEIEVK